MVEHWMTFGTFAQQDYFAYPTPTTYQGVIVNANMVAHAPAGIAAFLLGKTAGLKYLVDPQTHAFQHDPAAVTDSDGQPRSSLKKLADHYGPLVSERIGTFPILPEDFRKAPTRETFVRNVLDFQASRIKQQMQESDSAKYLEPAELAQLGAPHAVIAPYFYVTERTIDDWLDVNVQLASIAQEMFSKIAPNSKLFAGVVVSKGILTDNVVRKQYIDAMRKPQVAGYIVWVDEMDEVVASESELLGLLALVRGLRGKDKRETLNLHGGYFSVLAGSKLGKAAFTGVAHGPEFGEFRGVVPVGGGIPIARYYVPKLHARIKYREALRMLNTKGYLETAEVFHRRVCSCLLCKETLNGDAGRFSLFGEATVRTVRRGRGIVRIEFPTNDAKVRCLRHYLQKKYVEYQTASSEDDNSIILSKNLKDGAEEYRGVAGVDGVAHLNLWEKVLR